jgi:predicted alpha/beta hydrolase family esterase
MAKVGIVFIHGLGASAKTWKRFKDLINVDSELKETAIESYEYPTGRLLWGKPTIEDLAQSLRTLVDTSLKDCQEIVLVCHSMGGLVAQQYLIEEAKNNRASRIDKVIMFATPHKGSHIADIATHFPVQKQIAQLATDSSFISKLEEDWYKYNVGLKFRTINVIGTLDRYVKASSAQALGQRLVYVNHDHSSIVSPSSKDDLSFKVLKECLSESRSLIQLIKKETIKHAERIIKLKASIVTRSSVSPTVISRKVFRNTKQVRHSVNPAGELKVEEIRIPLNFPDAFASSSLNFVFGEMGSGKSTLLADYVKQLACSEVFNIPLFILADEFKSAEVESVEMLEGVLDAFLTRTLKQELLGYTLSGLIERSVPCTIVIDGFDELSLQSAGKLLKAAADLVRDNGNVRIIATGRPVELSGIDYGEWQILNLEPLTQANIIDLFQCEALNEGLTLEQALAKAKAKYELVNAKAQLVTMVSTPLMARLIYKYLDASTQTSIGVMLYNALLERLGGWDKDNIVEEPLQTFEKIYPSPSSREFIAAEVANAIYCSSTKSLSEQAVYELLNKIIPKDAHSNQLVNEVKIFLERNLLFREDAQYTFVAQPLLQVSIGLFIYLTSKGGTSYAPVESQWRELAYACAIANVKNSVNTLVQVAKTFITSITKQYHCVSYEAAHVIVESQSVELAKYLLFDLSPDLPKRPLSIPYEVSGWSRDYACLLVMTEEAGFKWFYDRYLDAKYPIFLWHWQVVESVLESWAILVDFRPSAFQQGLLVQMAVYHQMAPGFSSERILRLCSLLLPQLFDDETRVRFLLECLRYTDLSFHAATELKKEKEDTIQVQLLSLVKSDKKANYILAKFWVSHYDGDLPLQVVGSLVTTSNDIELRENLAAIERSIGTEVLQAFMRWFCISKDAIAPYAALALYNLGNKDLYLLGDALISGLHDGGKLEKAEETLESIVENAGEEGVQWLFEKIVSEHSDHDVHSAHWRIVLKRLITINATFTNQLFVVINKINGHILPRYPEVRALFEELLRVKPIYYKVLERALGSLDSKRRFNALCIKVVLFPKESLQELLVLIKSVDQHSETGELYRFILKLHFGRPLLDELQKKAEQLTEVATVYLLLLLYHNKLLLDQKRYEALVASVLEKYWSLNNSMTFVKDELPNILQEDRTFKVLKDILDSTPDLEGKAAIELIRHFPERFEEKELNVLKLLYECRGAIRSKDSYSLRNIRYLARKTAVNVEDDVFENIRLKPIFTSHPLLKEIIRRTYNNDIWRDFIWSAFATSNFSREKDDLIDYLFEEVRKDAKLRNVLAIVCKELLNDARWKEEGAYRRREERLWVELLTNECGSLPNESITRFITIPHQSVDIEVIRGLLARSEQMVSPLTSEVKSNAVQDEEEELKLILRDELGYHPAIIPKIEEMLAIGSYEEQCALLSAHSKAGCTVASIISFCRGKVNCNWLADAVEVSEHRVSQNDTTTHKINSAVRKMREVIVESELESTYLSIIRTMAISSPNFSYFKVLVVREHTFDMALMDVYCKFMEAEDYQIPSWFAHEFCNVIIGVELPLRDTLMNEIVRGSERLSNILHLPGSSHDYMSPWCFALAKIYMLGREDEVSTSLFLHGLKEGFMSRRGSVMSFSHVRDLVIMELIEKTSVLYEKIDHDILVRLISAGSVSEDVEIRGICRLLRALIQPEVLKL